MFRRVATSTSALAARNASPSSAALASTAQQRQVTSCSIIFSGITCYLCMLCWGSWFNNFANVRKYGLWRFRNQLDDNILVTDYKTARYFGCFVGVIFYCTLVGPRKYNRKSSTLEQHPGWVRYGPL